MKQTRLPKGWDDARVKRVLAHYESQTEEQAATEDGQAWQDRKATFVEVPTELLPAVRRLLAAKTA
jgi:hypothetical protein